MEYGRRRDPEDLRTDLDQSRADHYEAERDKYISISREAMRSYANTSQYDDYNKEEASTMNMTLTLIRPAVLMCADDPHTIKHLHPEDAPTIEYVAHVPGGMVRVRHEGAEWLMNPVATNELGAKTK